MLIGFLMNKISLDFPIYNNNYYYTGILYFGCADK